METGEPQIIDTCPSCAGSIDVSTELPFAQIYCPHCGEGMRARKIFNNFELVELIGEGGMGSVFKAYDHSLERMVALKVLRREMSVRQEEKARLEQEARITASVNHPHVVRVYSFGEADGQFYLAMELVEKGSLDDLMSIQTRVPEAQVLEIGMQIAQGLEAASEKGLIHRDVKPGNILFADAHTTKIVDFGLARVLEEEAEARGEIWGTPYYIAPERLNLEPEDFRSDIYSLGGTLFHAIAGRPPFEAESASLVALKQIKSQPVSLEAFAPDAAPETAYVINRMLEKNPDDRYQDYGELIEHLEFARSKVLERAGRPMGARREVVSVETSRTKLYVTAISVAAALMLLAGAVYLFFASDMESIKSLREAVMAGVSSDPFAKGMRDLGAGKYAQAREPLAAAVAAAPVDSERGQLARLSLALAQELGGEREKALQVFREVREAGLFSDRAADLALANAFLYAADFGAREKPVKFEELRNYPQAGPEVLAFLFAGAANYSLGDKKGAEKFLQHFAEAEAPDGLAWWEDYRKLAVKLLSP